MWTRFTAVVDRAEFLLPATQSFIDTQAMQPARQDLIRHLFEDYMEMYASRDDLLITRFSDNFGGYTGGGNFLVKDRQSWVNITEQDFAQVPGRLQIELLDLLLQDLSDDVVVATGLIHIQLPVPEDDMIRRSVRLTQVFRLEGEDWKIVYSCYSIPDQLVRDGEVYPIQGLHEQNQKLQRLLEERTRELESAQHRLRTLTSVRNQVRECLEGRLIEDSDEATIARALNLSTRTLVRRLQAEGTSFHDVKDQLRQDIALRLLREGQQPIGDIAAHIGFESLTAFHRAFKAWTGSTPLAFRRQDERRAGWQEPPSDAHGV